MTKQKKPQKKQPDSVFQEAWKNMSDDLNKLLPKKLRQTQGKKKLLIWLFIVELVVLGAIGTAVYRWWLG
ncbi:MAG: hypothetical protein IH614_15555 [Desulfuromonadales bacterium]|nr:hypothetical protein [Desulfuromonadales bacterium]